MAPIVGKRVGAASKSMARSSTVVVVVGGIGAPYIELGNALDPLPTTYLKGGGQTAKDDDTPTWSECKILLLWVFAVPL